MRINDYKTKMEYKPYKGNEAQFEKRHEDIMRLEGEFKKDALKAVGLDGHPKAEKAYSFAWELGHSSGLGEVYSYLCDIAEVIL